MTRATHIVARHPHNASFAPVNGANSEELHGETFSIDV